MTNEQIIEAALECGFSVEPATGMIYAEDGFTKVSCKHGLTELAKHFYRQGLLDGAAEFDRRDDGNGFYDPHEPAEILRKMAEVTQ
jgi:hypothetical protein